MHRVCARPGDRKTATRLHQAPRGLLTDAEAQGIKTKNKPTVLVMHCLRCTRSLPDLVLGLRAALVGLLRGRGGAPHLRDLRPAPSSAEHPGTPGCSQRMPVHALRELLCVPVLRTNATACTLGVAGACALAPSPVPEAGASHQANALEPEACARWSTAATLPVHMHAAMKSFRHKLSNLRCTSIHVSRHCGAAEPGARAPAPPATASAR